MLLLLYYYLTKYILLSFSAVFFCVKFLKKKVTFNRIILFKKGKLLPSHQPLDLVKISLYL